MLRLFVAVPIPDDVADKIARLQTGLDGAKWSPRENLHLTLRFVGAIDQRQAEDLDTALGDIRVPPFSIDLQGIGYFGSNEPHAIWLGVKTNSFLSTLQNRCERACRLTGLAPAPRAYTPHVTICYLPRHQFLDSVLAFQQSRNLFTVPSWTADRFYLYASRTNGPGPSRYSIEAEYPLVG